jgi:hypothetical protein
MNVMDLWAMHQWFVRDLLFAVKKERENQIRQNKPAQKICKLRGRAIEAKNTILLFLFFLGKI